MVFSAQHIYIYHSYTDSRAIFGIFFSATNKAAVFVVDTVVNNQLPNIKYTLDVTYSLVPVW